MLDVVMQRVQHHIQHLYLPLCFCRCYNVHIPVDEKRTACLQVCTIDDHDS